MFLRKNIKSLKYEVIEVIVFCSAFMTVEIKKKKKLLQPLGKLESTLFETMFS